MKSFSDEFYDEFLLVWIFAIVTELKLCHSIEDANEINQAFSVHESTKDKNKKFPTISPRLGQLPLNPLPSVLIRLP